MKSIRVTVSASIATSFIAAVIISFFVCNWLAHKNQLYRQSKELESIAYVIAALKPNKKSFAQDKSDLSYLIQAFNKDQELLFKSPKLTSNPLLTKANIAKKITIDNSPWLAYRLNDKKTGMSIIIAAPSQLTFFASDDIWLGILVLITIVICVLALLIYFSLHWSLRPLFNLSKDLSERAAAKLEAINFHQYPLELRSLLKELNLLFSRVKYDYDKNKRFSADAAHELRTPLTALKTQAQLAIEMPDPIEQKNAIKNVLISVDRSIHVVQQLLTLSRLDHEDKLNDVREINLETVCAEIMAFMYPQALKKNIEIELYNNCKQPLIMGNDAALGILLRNLLDNAIRYTENDGKVNVSIQQSNKHIILQITDNGPGIPNEYRDKVFDRFFRVLGTKETGSGLGLAIVKQITHLHKAKIRLQSGEGGKGLVVNIVFRRSKQD